ncbi:Yip1 family protein [Streptomyces sp. NPDC056361]|uniref:Yip1 family protein n=1 Tax=Streptomyces sp. NPDC056361 TaxID=3345795 RepID=UPI0035E2AC3F
MGIRPWVVVEPPDRRGLRRITIHGKTVGSAWSLGELRKVIRRLGYPDDMDLDDPSRVHWRGGDSSVWPDDRGWRRHLVICLMLVGLLGSMGLHLVIGWADALEALTFAQRLVGVLFLLAGAVQGAALPAVVDHWGRQQVRLSGALVLLGVLMALATSTLLLFLWLQEREFIATVPLFLALWLWSLWALHILIREKVWRGIPHPRKFAAGVTITAILTAVSLGYSLVYQPIAAPLHFTLKAEFGKPQTDADSPYIHVPLKLSAKNAGGIPVYIIVDDYSVYGEMAEFAEDGQGVKEWKSDEGDVYWNSDAQAFEKGATSEIIASGQFQGPWSTLDIGEEYKMERVITLPKATKFETLNAELSFTFLRQDRGKLDDDFYADPSWVEADGGRCAPDDCGEQVIFHGRVRYNNNLINVTRKPRYAVAFWSPQEVVDGFVTSIDLAGREKIPSLDELYGDLDENDIQTEAERYGIGWVSGNSKVSVKGLLKQAAQP